MTQGRCCREGISGVVLRLLVVATCLLAQQTSLGFVFQGMPSGDRPSWHLKAETSEEGALSRRRAMEFLVAVPAVAGGLVENTNAFDIPFLSDSGPLEEGYRPAKRCRAYLVDSTIPPTLIPYRDGRHAAILKNLGAGYGTRKSPLLDESLTLNNLLNKTVAASINLVSPDPAKSKKTGVGAANFVFLGYDIASSEDTSLAQSILSDILVTRKRNSPTALGLSWAPQSTQPALDRYANGSIDAAALQRAMEESGVSPQSFNTQRPLLDAAVQKKLTLLALAPEVDDLLTVRREGLQNLPVERRASYVKDSRGFIETTQDPKFRLYADRSMLKEYQPLSDQDSSSAFYAQQILYDEAVATAAAQWALPQVEALVVVPSKLPNVRFMGGANGRLARICNFLGGSKVDESSVTTILLNPTAKNTCSASNYLRTVIGTGPETIAYQTKVADYLWFSKMPKVNMLPHMMNVQ